MRTFIQTQLDGHIAQLLINRPDKLNALDRDVLAELSNALRELAEVRDLRAVVVTGEGKAFVAGADIASMKPMTRAQAREFSALGHETFDLLESLPCPVIAAVNGFALGGGCELALACDFIYASTKAKFGQPEVGLGVIPGFGGTQRLPRRVGPGMARELIYTGRLINAEEALRIGLANAVFEPGDLLTAAHKTATEIAAKGPSAVAVAKRVMLEGADCGLRDANALEAVAFSDGFESAEQGEGMSAFIERREATFGPRK